jgi:hypothetical protein
MLDFLSHSLIALSAQTLLVLAVIGRILLRPNRDPASRIAWILVVAALPLIGMITYLLLGETNIGRNRIARLRAALARLPPTDGPCFHASESAYPHVPERYRHEVRRRQQDYLARSHRVTEEKVDAWSTPRRLWNNSIAMMSPLL